MSFRCREPSRGAPDSPCVSSDAERELSTTRTTKAVTRRRRKIVRSMAAFGRRKAKRRNRLHLARHWRRACARVKKAFHALSCKFTGSGDPTQTTLNKLQDAEKEFKFGELCIGTFNAKRLKSKWRRLELAAWCSHKGVRILGVQEHCLRFDGDPSEIRTENLGGGWRFLYTSAHANGQGGVGCILSPMVIHSVIQSESICPRILRVTLRWKSDGRKACVLVGYAPTAVADEAERSTFYDQLGAEVARTPARDFLCVAGDLNATLRPEDHKLQFLPVQNANDNSDLLADLLSAENLLSAGAAFCQNPNLPSHLLRSSQETSKSGSFRPLIGQTEAKKPDKNRWDETVFHTDSRFGSPTSLSNSAHTTPSRASSTKTCTQKLELITK